MKNKIIDLINKPNDIKKLNLEQLSELANEVRSMIIETAKNVDLHLSSNLGVVELSIAILKVFDIENDYILYDTGHQTYAHKILTDRKDRFHLLKKENGLCGLMSMLESKYDHYSPGHCGNISSLASGIYESININKKNKKIITVIGDSAFANGLNLEAINDITYNNVPIITILNDNDMSISKAVGSLSSIFNKLKKEKDNSNNNFFTQLGFDYIGPIDGHDLKKLIKALETAKDKINNKPILVHVITKKGKGLKDAEDDVIGDYHSYINVNKKSYGMYASEYISELMSKHNDICVVNPAMNCASKCDIIYSRFPNRYFDVGIAEEHAIAKAGGMSLAGLVPYVFIYATFLQRAYDQLLHDLSRLQLKCNLLIDRADLAPAEGSTHHGIFDVNILKSFPNTIITSPRNIDQLKQLIDISYKENKNKIFAIRYPRSDFLKMDDLNSNYKIEWGTWETLKTSSAKILIISYGPFINMIYEKIASKYNVDLINAIFITGYNKQNLDHIFSKYDHIIVYERIHGSLGLINDLKIFKADNNLSNKLYGMHYHGQIEYGTMDSLEKQQHMHISDIESLVKKLI